MFVTQKMVLIDLLVLEENVEDVSKLIIKAGYFEPTTYSSISADDAWHTESTTDKKRMLSAFQKDAQAIKMYFDPQGDFKSPKSRTQNEIYTIPVISDMIRQYVQKKRQLEERAAVIRRQKEDYAVIGFNLIKSILKNLFCGLILYSLLQSGFSKILVLN